MLVTDRSRLFASIVAALTATSVWLSAGTLAVTGGDASRVAALPSLTVLAALVVAAVAIAAFLRLRLPQAWPLTLSLLIWLPFIPAPVPAAFLVWQGPLEWFVWTVVVSGLAANNAWTIRGAVDPRVAPWILAAIVALASLAAFANVPDVIPGGDEPHYLAATQSLIKDADLRVENNYANGDYLEYFPGRLDPHFLKRSTGGDIYSIHAPGVSVAVLPAFAVAGYEGAVLTIVALAALTAALTWRLAWRVSNSFAGAWLGTIAVMLSAPYFFHTFTIYPEVVGGFCVMVGVGLLVALSEGRVPSSRALFGAGTALAVLPWLHSRFAVIAAALGVAIAARLFARDRDLKAVARLLAVPVIAAATWFAFFWAIWGSPSPAAPYGADTSTSTDYVLRGLIGLMVDQQFGLLATAPVFAVALLGMFPLARRRPRLAIELSVAVVAYAVAVACYAMWWAGSAAPARFLVAVLPIGALAIAAWVADRKETVVAPLLCIISVALIVPRALVEGGRFIYNGRATYDATLEWLSPIVNLPLAMPSVHRDGGSVAIRDAAIWVAALAVIYVIARSVARKSAGARWAVTCWAAALAAMVASTLVWNFRDAPIVTPDRSKLAALADLRAWKTHTLHIVPLRRIAFGDFLALMSFEIALPVARINRVPAGEYDLILDAPAVPQLRLFVGRNDPPIESLPIDGRSDNSSGYRLRLPVSVQTLNLATAGSTPAPVTSMTVRPVALVSAASGRAAVRAARYGDARAFAFDEQVYLERDGFWVRGDADTAVVIDSNDAAMRGGLPLAVVAGPVATTITVSANGWRETLTLGAGETRHLTLPPSDNATWAVSLKSGAGFRPSQREPGNRDVRLLAAWISLLR